MSMEPEPEPELECQPLVAALEAAARFGPSWAEADRPGATYKPESPLVRFST